jgi:hypothetical protein
MPNSMKQLIHANELKLWKVKNKYVGTSEEKFVKLMLSNFNYIPRELIDLACRKAFRIVRDLKLLHVRK